MLAATPHKVLIVEDDPAVSKMLGLVLRSAGFATGFASDGGSAISEIDRDHVDAVVLDLGLPDGRASDLLGLLRSTDDDERGEHTVWVVISAMDPIDVERRYGSLSGRFFSKPFDPWTLVDKLKSLLRDR